MTTTKTPILARQFAFLLILVVLPAVNENASFAQQRYQAMSLSLLTELPERDGLQQDRIGWGLATHGGASRFAEELEELLEQPGTLDDNAVIAALALYEKAAGKRSTKIDALANRGRFVVGFTYENAQSDLALRELLGRQFDNNWRFFVTGSRRRTKASRCVDGQREFLAGRKIRWRRRFSFTQQIRSHRRKSGTTLSILA